MATWRYFAQNLLTGEFTHTDLPLRRDELTWQLSGPGALKGTISPEVLGLGPLEEWQTAIYAEADDEIRWGGILRNRGMRGAELTLDCAGFSSYPARIPYTGPDYVKINADPTGIFIYIWDHLQSQPDGDLGVQIVRPNTSPVRVGKPAIPGYREYQIGGVWTRNPPAGSVVTDKTGALAAPMTKTQTTLTLSKLAGFDTLSMPYTVKIGSEQLRVTARSGLKLTVTRGYSTSTASVHSTGTQVRFTDGTPVRNIDKIEAEPYTLYWYEAPDCGDELARLAEETPFDFVESHAWVGSSSTISHTITLGYPRVGQKRPELTFVQHANIDSLVPVARDGENFANIIYGLGKGEGAKMVRGEVAHRDGRLRRPYVYTDKTAATKERITAAARKQFRYRGLLPDIESITVRDHPNAPIGSWRTGDDILVQADLPWAGEVAIWCRIVSWSLTSETTATLSLARSDSFAYGGLDG